MSEAGPAPILHPDLQQLAEAWLQRPLEGAEAQRLLAFQQGLTQQDAGAQLKQQAAQTVDASRARATASVRDTLQTIQASTGQALQQQAQEEAAILKLVDGARTLADLRPSTLQPGAQPGGAQMVLSQIADRLAGLAKQEVEACFNQYFGPLSQELQAVIARLAKQQDAATPPASTDPGPAS
ncbi:hypothetical protein [Chitinolyticbacter albus]|uniref:hypothetical protein n=1 Tax=Chitinolyticbacter albus TaxID=2961951 RepID=UPI00210C13E3|nr:hypothetical protein [Chitinolyticbacter albus]